MAQTKRKRKSKHRGNAAGTVQARGRTSRPLPEKERRSQARQVAREDRLSKPPTWGRSARVAGIAGLFMFLALFLISPGNKTKTVHGHTITTTVSAGNRLFQALVFAALAVTFYIPAGYYMERFLWRRRMTKKAAVHK
jgi:hypothetical protein